MPSLPNMSSSRASSSFLLLHSFIVPGVRVGTWDNQEFLFAPATTTRLKPRESDSGTIRSPRYRGVVAEKDVMNRKGFHGEVVLGQASSKGGNVTPSW
jgi:hypothetical protein